MMPLRWYAVGVAMAAVCSMAAGHEIHLIQAKGGNWDSFMSGVLCTLNLMIVALFAYGMVKDAWRKRTSR